MENLGIIIISVAMIFLATAFIFLIVSLYKYFMDDNVQKQRKFQWKGIAMFFVIYIVLITLGIIIINQ